MRSAKDPGGFADGRGADLVEIERTTDTSGEAVDGAEVPELLAESAVSPHHVPEGHYGEGGEEGKWGRDEIEREQGAGHRTVDEQHPHRLEIVDDSPQGIVDESRDGDRHSDGTDHACGGDGQRRGDHGVDVRDRIGREHRVDDQVRDGRLEPEQGEVEQQLVDGRPLDDDEDDSACDQATGDPGERIEVDQREDEGDLRQREQDGIAPELDAEDREQRRAEPSGDQGNCPDLGRSQRRTEIVDGECRDERERCEQHGQAHHLERGAASERGVGVRANSVRACAR